MLRRKKWNNWSTYNLYLPPKPNFEMIHRQWAECWWRMWKLWMSLLWSKPTDTLRQLDHLKLRLVVQAFWIGLCVVSCLLTRSIVVGELNCLKFVNVTNRISIYYSFFCLWITVLFIRLQWSWIRVFVVAATCLCWCFLFTVYLILLLPHFLIVSFWSK